MNYPNEPDAWDQGVAERDAADDFAYDEWSVRDLLEDDTAAAPEPPAIHNVGMRPSWERL